MQRDAAILVAGLLPWLRDCVERGGDDRFSAVVVLLLFADEGSGDALALLRELTGEKMN